MKILFRKTILMALVAALGLASSAVRQRIRGGGKGPVPTQRIQ